MAQERISLVINDKCHERWQTRNELAMSTGK
jgi:hypothetical protein